MRMRMRMETRAGNGDSDKVGDKDGNMDRHEIRDEVGNRDREEDRDSHEIGSGEMLLVQPPQSHTPAGLAVAAGGDWGTE